MHTPGSLPSCGFTLHEQVARVSLSGVSTPSDRLGAGSQKQNHGLSDSRLCLWPGSQRPPVMCPLVIPRALPCLRVGGTLGQGLSTPSSPPRPLGVTMSESLQVRLQLARP